MSNILDKIVHDIAVPFEWLDKAEKVIGQAIVSEPALKSAVVELVQRVEVLIGDGSSDVADKGLNVADDAKTLADLEAFGAWFTASFVPVVTALYVEVKTDLAA
jgi:hypothetical protein